MWPRLWLQAPSAPCTIPQGSFASSQVRDPRWQRSLGLGSRFTVLLCEVRLRTTRLRGRSVLTPSELTAVSVQKARREEQPLA